MQNFLTKYLIKCVFFADVMDHYEHYNKEPKNLELVTGECGHSID